MQFTSIKIVDTFFKDLTLNSYLSIYKNGGRWVELIAHSPKMSFGKSCVVDVLEWCRPMYPKVHYRHPTREWDARATEARNFIEKEIQNPSIKGPGNVLKLMV